MNHRKAVECLVVFVAMSILIPVQASLPFSSARLAQIDAKGTLVLQSVDERSFYLTIDRSFTSTVPSSVAIGSYEDVAFHGAATVSRGREAVTVRFEGLLTSNEFGFWVKFDIDKTPDLKIPSPLDIPGIPDIPRGPIPEKFIASGKLNIAVSELTSPAPELTWILMKGKVTGYGGKLASGGLVAHAKVSETDDSTEVHGASAAQYPTEAAGDNNDLSVSFRAVTLAIATKTELNYDGNDLYIEGSWNVHNISVAVGTNSIETTVHPLVEGASGSLEVVLASKWSPIPGQTQGAFTLQIEGIEKISGEVACYNVRMTGPSEYGIPLGDFDKDRTVSILDIIKVAQAFGAKLGLPKYDIDMDINCDFVINILDIMAVAREFGEEY